MSSCAAPARGRLRRSFGIWTGTWEPRWSGDYRPTLTCSSTRNWRTAPTWPTACRVYLWDSFLPDLRRNARACPLQRDPARQPRMPTTGWPCTGTTPGPATEWTPSTSWITLNSTTFSCLAQLVLLLPPGPIPVRTSSPSAASSMPLAIVQRVPILAAMRGEREAAIATSTVIGRNASPVVIAS